MLQQGTLHTSPWKMFIIREKPGPVYGKLAKWNESVTSTFEKIYGKYVEMGEKLCILWFFFLQKCDLEAVL